MGKLSAMKAVVGGFNHSEAGRDFAGQISASCSDQHAFVANRGMEAKAGLSVSGPSPVTP